MVVLYGGLLLLGLFTALLTSFYTFRMVFVVFHGEQENPLPVGSGTSRLRS